MCFSTNLIAVPQEAQTGTLSGPPGVPPVLITASPILPLTAPTPVGLGGGPLGAEGAGVTWGVKGLAAGAWSMGFWPPGDHTAGFGAESKECIFQNKKYTELLLIFLLAYQF